MGFYQHLRETWQNLDSNLLRERLVKWRQEPAILRIERPTRLDRARSLGYKAKLGYVVVRVKVRRSRRFRMKFKGGRRPKAMRRKKVVNLSYQSIAEARANDKYPNCEVLNSYFVAKDGMHIWHEIILVDKNHPAIKADERISWISNPEHTGRVYRGLTSSMKKTRGMLRKGKGAEKVRPSRRAKGRMSH